MKRYLEAEHPVEGVDQWRRRDLYRRVSDTGLVADPNAQFAFMTLRKLSSHTDNSATTSMVAVAIPGSSIARAALIEELAVRLGDFALARAEWQIIEGVLRRHLGGTEVGALGTRNYSRILKPLSDLDPALAELPGA